MKFYCLNLTIFSIIISLFMTNQTFADDNSKLAKQLANPIAALISLPLQLNYDQDIGSDDNGTRLTLNIQPVVPIELNEDWNIISRTILPVMTQDNIFADGDSQTGVGDIVQSVFFSPKKLTDSGWVWGAGPVFLLPTGSDDKLTADKWGAGPTAVALKQQGPWTFGALANHIWSFAGEEERADINSTYLQPFLSYTTPAAWTFGVSTESTYDWESESWTVPVVFNISKVTKFGNQLVSISAGVRYWVKDTSNSPEGTSLRLQLTYLFPK